MPDEPNGNSEDPADKTPQKQKSRRVSNKSPRKAAKQSSKKEITPKADSGESTQAGENPSVASSDERESRAKVENGDAGKQDQKRNNRRRRGKGKSASPAQNSDPGNEADSPGDKPSTQSQDEIEEAANNKRDQSSHNAQVQNRKRSPKKQQSQLDPEKVANKAWKIFLAEVSEEGVALIGDNDARELSRRCFRLAEIFIEEQSRRG